MENIIIKEKKLFELFPEINIKNEYHDLLSEVKIENINVYKKSRRLEIALLSDKLIPAGILTEIEANFISSFSLDGISIKARFDLDIPFPEALGSYWDSILFFLNKKYAVSKGILSGCNFNLNDKKLEVNIKSQGSRVLISQGCDRFLEELLEELFSVKIKAVFLDNEEEKGVSEEYLKLKEDQESKIISETITLSNSNGKDKSKPKREPQSSGSVVGIILGKGFNDKLLNMIDVNQDSGKVAIQGNVFRVEFREIRGERFLCTFDMTDYTSSVSVKFFIEKGDIDLIKEKVRENIYIKVKGEAQYDKFSKELSILASDIIEIEKEFKKDLAEHKRVELHLHTQMSAMDAVTPAKDLVKRAAAWGHKAVAITDHGVVQAYPEAFDAGKKNNIKIIYGVECYLLDDSVPIVYNSKKHSFDEDFVVFDIETTGLNSSKDKITEIGAVKIRNGKIIERFSSFVNPMVPIPSMIVKLTGITDEMVQDAPPIESVLLEFMEFINNSVLVAHNAPFDIGFIKHFAKLAGEHINNPVVDTLQLCRRMFPNLDKYRLNVVAKHLGVLLENHHRAVDDSKATAEIFMKCMELLKEKGVGSIDEIEDSLGEVKNFTKAESYHAIILVKNLTGLKNLYKIVSESHLKYFHKRPSFKLAGFECRTTWKDGANKIDAPKHWNTYHGCRLYDKIGIQTDPISRFDIGMITSYDFENSRFSYIIGIEVDDFIEISKECTKMIVPAARYAVFRTPPADTHTFVRNIHMTWDYIYRVWLPQTGFQHTGTYEFETYCEESRTFSEEIWIPIEERKA